MCSWMCRSGNVWLQCRRLSWLDRKQLGRLQLHSGEESVGVRAYLATV